MHTPVIVYSAKDFNKNELSIINRTFQYCLIERS